MRTGLVQFCGSDDPQANLQVVSDYIAEAASAGARFILTPEVTNCVSASRTHQQSVLQTEDDDLTLKALAIEAERNGVWVLIGSLALKARDEDRFVNRSFLISPAGEIIARYDKIHMFDVAINEVETYRESDGYRPGTKAVVADLDGMPLGMTICYDLRFPYLYRGLAKSGAKIMTVPSAFSPDTGAAHWEVLLRARAIETGSYILAPAQCGTHPTTRGRQRSTYGHSMVVDPWGQVVLDAGAAPGVHVVDLKIEDVDDVRRRIPSLIHERDYTKAQ